MAVVRGGGSSVPISFPCGDDGFAWVPSSVLSVRFNLQLTSIWVEEELFDSEGVEIVSTVIQLKFKNEEGDVWRLTQGKYHAFGTPSIVRSVSTDVLTPGSAKSTLHMPWGGRVKIESPNPSHIDLTESSDDDTILVNEAIAKLSPISEMGNDTNLVPNQNIHDSIMPSLGTKSMSQFQSVFQCLTDMQSRPRARNELKFLNLDTLRCESVRHLPQSFDGDVLFELPPLSSSASSSASLPGSSTYVSVGRQLEGMDRKFDGHNWTHTHTTNIANDFGLKFRSSFCVGHLVCENPDCARVRRGGSPNETEWEGSSPVIFAVGNQSPEKSNLVCRICKVSPSCKSLCPCRMYRVLNSSGFPRACIHIGHHQHPVRRGICRDSVEHTTSLISQQVSKTPSATNSAISLAASKEFLASELFCEEGLQSDPKPLQGEALEAVMEKFRILSSPSIRNTISNFRHSASGGTIDNIISLKMKSTYSFIQDSVFPGQGKDKVYLFKMSEEGPGSGVDLVRRMQPGGDLQNSWCMFDHVKRVKGWTSMAAHVYDPEFCRVQTICICDMMSEDAKSQEQMWRSLNSVMARHGISSINFKGFMADNAMANWHAVRVVYGSGNKQEPMQDRERSCLLHWTTSLNRHTEKLIRPEFQETHKKLCKQYKDAKSMAEAEERYLGIKGWWLSSRAASEDSLRELDDWLGFWHFRYRQWGGFLELNLNLEELAEMPSCNLAETVHNKWLQMSGKRGTCLYVATTDDMMRAIQQSTNYWAYLQGYASGTGPHLDELRLRAARRTKNPTKFAEAVAKLPGVDQFSTRVPHLEGEEVFGSSKRKLNLPPGSDGDSHRHDTVNFSIPRVQTRSTRARTAAGASTPLSTQEGEPSTRHPHATKVFETDCNPSLWHIARCKKEGKTCHGVQAGMKKKCGAKINKSKRSGTAAPTYNGRMTEYGTKAVINFDFWFCADDLLRCVGGSKVKWVHDWPPPPSVWPVARGTHLSKSEILSLEEAGFQLQTEDVGELAPQLFYEESTERGVSFLHPKQLDTYMQPSNGDLHPTKRLGRTIRRNPNAPTVDHRNKWETARNLKAVVQSVVVIPYPGYGRVITLMSGIFPVQKVYRITISDFPACTCEDFITMSTGALGSRKSWVNCKHLYYIFRFLCKANLEDDKYIHAPSLSFDEVKVLLASGNLENV